MGSTTSLNQLTIDFEYPGIATTKLISKDMMEGISGCVCYLSGFHLKLFLPDAELFLLVIVSLTVVGQSVKHPTPQDIRESVNDTSKSDKYTIINYSISGIRKPLIWDAMKVARLTRR